ncbi:DHA2 family efflux MFS transporter permease subunit [Rummeliibacillus stabekisii]|uniref:DHA2 family efflux MFS transporter permease subunit n=1 Tax=Rummeliibacillus stabekisii TaxID=241244 RepID=UPI0011704A6A|nr:DHA2 family efflux MFS transporter permease subunit [Rummeliibacillus stabekisii]MBB5171398.1 EmrB/QacA subfamily drug resistance transporter [Rummeliibacillus stabekisii]GEL05705.1 MFS transporter [Rummeliibacillus stabekisii]
MSIYIIGYILISVILLIVVNFMVRRQKNSNTKDEKVTQGTMANKNQKMDSKKPVEVQEFNNAAPQPVQEEEHAEEIQEPKKEEATEEVPPVREEAKTPPAKVIDNKGKLLVTMMIGAFVAILNQTLLNVAIPHIMNDLSVSASTVQWLSTGYMLTNGVFIPITAFLITRLGTRKLFISAITSFTIGSIICSLSTTFSLLMLGRVVQAAGAGVIMPLLMTVFLTIFPPEKRGAAMGLFGVAILFAPAIGPTLSGWLIGHYSWRVLFDIVIPVGIVAILMALKWMVDVVEITKPKFDTFGFIFSTIGFGFLLYGFSEAGNNGWDSKVVLISLAIGIIGLIAFAWRELTVEQPMLDLRVFKYDIFTLTTIISMIINMAMFAAMLLLPIYLQNIRGFSALDSGLLMLPGAIVMAIMLPISGKLFDKMGARWLAVIGLVITVVTTYQFSKLSMTTSYSYIMLLYVMRMFGMSFLSMTVSTEGMNQLPQHLVGHGTSASNTARTVAGSIGTAFLVTVMTTRSNFHTANYGNVISSDNPYLTNQLHSLGSTFSAMAGLPAQGGQVLATSSIYGQAVKHATVSGINDAFIVATGIAAVALVLAFFIKRAKPNAKD